MKKNKITPLFLNIYKTQLKMDQSLNAGPETTKLLEVSKGEAP
jgi:hypothetical protein